MAINIPPASVTIQEVADLAKVSPKTVSRVINNEPRVRSDTRARILEAIETLKYRPNLNARGLASNRSFLIGLFCEKPGDYLSEFQAGAVARCRRRRRRVRPAGHQDDPAERDDADQPNEGGDTDQRGNGEVHEVLPVSSRRSSRRRS